MSVPDTSLDRRSLTLPDWRGALSRVRRWKPPTPKNWVALALFLMNLVALPSNYLDGDVLMVGYDLIAMAGWWRVTWREPHELRDGWTLAFMAFVIACFPAVVISWVI